MKCDFGNKVSKFNKRVAHALPGGTDKAIPRSVMMIVLLVGSECARTFIVKYRGAMYLLITVIITYL